MRWLPLVLSILAACAYDTLGPGGAADDDVPDAATSAHDAGPDAGNPDAGNPDAGPDAGTCVDERSDVSRCASAGLDCGSTALEDNCGVVVSVQCGTTCRSGFQCAGGGQPNRCDRPPSGLRTASLVADAPIVTNRIIPSTDGDSVLFPYSTGSQLLRLTEWSGSFFVRSPTVSFATGPTLPAHAFAGTRQGLAWLEQERSVYLAISTNDGSAWGTPVHIVTAPTGGTLSQVRLAGAPDGGFWLTYATSHVSSAGVTLVHVPNGGTMTQQTWADVSTMTRLVVDDAGLPHLVGAFEDGVKYLTTGSGSALHGFPVDANGVGGGITAFTPGHPAIVSYRVGEARLLEQQEPSRWTDTRLQYGIAYPDLADLLPADGAFDERGQVHLLVASANLTYLRYTGTGDWIRKDLDDGDWVGLPTLVLGPDRSVHITWLSGNRTTVTRTLRYAHLP